MAERVLQLEVEGRRIPLRYVEEPPFVYLLASRASNRWPAVVLRSGRATIDRGHGREVAAVTLEADPDVVENIVRRFLADAGPDAARDRYAPGTRLLCLSFAPGDAVGDPVERWVEREFDAIAPEYLARIGQNPVERRFRARSVETLRRLFPGPSRLVELGSGSGAETLPLLRAGHEVVALDVSQRMLDALGARARAEGFAEELTTVRARARDLPRLTGVLGPRPFDGAVSTFGALNLEPDLTPVARGLADHIRPGGVVLAGVASRWGVQELFVEFAHGRFASLLARRRTPVPAGTHRYGLDTYLRTVPELRAAFAEGFNVRAVEGVGLTLPSPVLGHGLDRRGFRWETADAWDRRLGARAWFAPFADQLFIEFVRKERGPSR